MEDKIKKLKEVTQDLRILYVEDELLTRAKTKKILEPLFKEVVIAEDGQIGLGKFRDSHMDIIITDNIMPNMDGIDMIREIRKEDTKTPIIVATAYIDIEYLMQAINLGVTQFVSKPVEQDALMNALEIAVQRVVVDNLTRKAQAQEIELLRYQEKYHSSQQENALKKEMNIIENDYFFKRIPVPGKEADKYEWLFNTTYEPLEILSGDSYSVRDMGDGKVLIYIVDGMGKGLSASVTTTLSIAFFNHLLDRVNDGELELDLSDLIMRYVNFIKKELLEEEIVSNTYVLIDFVEQTLEASIYSLPPILIEREDGSVDYIKSNNMPVTKYTFQAKTDKISIADAKKILVYSDGLNESFTDDGNIYGEFLEQDFKETDYMKTFLARFRSKVSECDDDLTLFYMKHTPKKYNSYKEFIAETELSEVERLTQDVEMYLQNDLGLTVDFIIPYLTTFTELAMNAYEHGNLGINTRQKTGLIKKGEYDDFLLEKEKEIDLKVFVELKTFEENGHTVLATYIRDEGNGFDTEILENLLVNNVENLMENGRGILMSKGFSDEILYNGKGNEVLYLNIINS